MELSYLLDCPIGLQTSNETFYEDNSQRPPSSMKRESSELDSSNEINRVKRSVQFPSDENLVFIKEIPPRGFFGSDVSESEDSCEDDTDEDESEKDDDNDDDNDVDNDDNDNDDDEDSESSDNERDNKRPLNFKILKTSTPIRRVSSFNTFKPVMTLMKSKPENSQPSVERSKPSVIRKCSSKRPRLLVRNQKGGNRITESGSKRHINKSRKNVSKSQTIMKPTISSQTKQINKTQHIAKAASPVLNKTTKATTKYPSKITIDSPIPFIKNNFISDENNQLYNYYVSGKMCQVKGFVFPIDHNDSVEYLPNIGFNHLDFRPFSKHKRSNAWQLANGTLDSTLFHTPSIAPMWENIQSVPTAKFKHKRYEHRF